MFITINVSKAHRKKEKKIKFSNILFLFVSNQRKKIVNDAKSIGMLKWLCFLFFFGCLFQHAQHNLKE